MISKLRGRRARLAAIAAGVVVLGAIGYAVFVSVAPPPPAPLSAALPAGASAGKAAQPAAASPPRPAVAGAGPVMSVPGAESAQRSAGSTAFAPADAAQGQTTAAPSFDRMVIRTGQLTVEVTEMEQALSQARQIATRAGGFVSASNTRVEKVNDQDRMVADMTLLVRSDAVDTALSELRGLGKVTTEASGSQDVTEEYVDLDSNLRNLQASESAILKLMDKATRIEDVLTLQRELTNIRGQIERIQGRKRFLERRSDMATITLALRLPGAEVTRPLGGGWDPVRVAQRGWQASLALLRGVAEVLIMVAAFSWWLIPFIALGVYLWLQRRRRTPAAAPAAQV